MCVVGLRRVLCGKGRVKWRGTAMAQSQRARNLWRCQVQSWTFLLNRQVTLDSKIASIHHFTISVTNALSPKCSYSWVNFYIQVHTFCKWRTPLPGPIYMQPTVTNETPVPVGVELRVYFLNLRLKWFFFIPVYQSVSTSELWRWPPFSGLCTIMLAEFLVRTQFSERPLLL